MSTAAVLTDFDVERVARRVVELLHAERQEPRPGELVDATTLARLLGVRRSTIYGRADELGAIRLGNGRRARLRFNVETARAALNSSDGASAALAPRTPSTRRHRATTSGAGSILTPRRSS